MNNTMQRGLGRGLPRLLGPLLTGAIVAVTSPAVADGPTPIRCVEASEEAGTLQKADKLGAAKASYLVCADAACPKDVREECVHRLSEVNDAMPSVVFEVKDASGNDLSDVRVTMDGTLLVEHVGPTAVTIDPGEHTFHFEGADPSLAIEKKLVIHDGEKNRPVDVVLGHIPAPEAPAAVIPTAAPPPPSVSNEPRPWSPPPAAPPSTAQRTAGAWIFWGGVAGMGVGGIVGLMAKQQFNSAQTETGSQQYNDSASAVATGNAATGIVIGGGVLAVVGWIVWQTAPNAQAAVAVSRNGLLLRGTF